VSQENRSPLGAGIIGGVLGSVLTAALLLAVAPSFLGPRIVREALTRDPEILVAGSEALQAKQNGEALKGIRAMVETPYNSSWKGSAKPDVTIAYFYDYACGYCRKSNPDLEKLIAEDKRLRVVYREFPILGPESVAAARVALAASKAGKFALFHDALTAAGRPTPETISAAANQAGITPAMVNDPTIEAEIRGNMNMAQQLRADGTPLFVIGDQIFNSAIGYDALKQAVAKARTATS
jgi:protein-disulfide isomerase